MLRDLGLKVKFPQRTFATVDHIVPTDQSGRAVRRPARRGNDQALRKNAEDFGITYFDLSTGKQGIVHVVGPEQGITQPGTTIACGDSHTATHGAFGAIAFGIGTTQVRDVLATQTMALQRAEGPPHQVERRPRAPASMPRTSSSTSSACSAPTAASATPTNTPAMSSTASRWKSA